MRKTFIKVCVAALSLLAVSSCGKIWDEFDSVHGELDNLAARITALEEKLNSEVATINSKIGAVEAAYKAADEKLAAADADLLAALKAGDKELADALAALNAELDALDGVVDGYIKSNDEALKKAIEDYKAAIAKAIEDYKAADVLLSKADTDLLAALAALGVSKVETNEAGNVVITFADGSKIEVPANPETGVVTVVDGEWAVVVDGKVTMLGVPVHPDTTLDFMVDEKTNELLVSYDDKKTWEKTGVIINDETTINVIESFEYEEGDKYVTVTVGGVEYKLPLYQADNSSLVLGRTEAYFVYGSSKKVELSAKDIKDYYVMSKPDGWKVSVDGTTLTITSPSEELVKLGAGETEGEVLVHATTKTGACKVATLKVTAGPTFTLSYVDGNINLFTAYAAASKNFFGEEIFDFVPLEWGVITMADYLAGGYASVEDYIAECAENYMTYGSLIQWAYNENYIEQNWYEEGVCEDITINLPLETIINDCTYGEMEYDEDEVYIFWILPSGATEYLTDEAVYLYTDSYVEFVESEASYNNVAFDANFIGADSYIVGALAKSMFDDWGISEEFTYEMALEEYMMQDMGMAWYNGPFINFIGGDKPALGSEYLNGVQTVNLADLVDPVDFNSEYFVWVLPYYENKALENYKYEDLLLYSTKTEPLTEDNSVAAVVEIGYVGYDAVEYTITPAEGASFYFGIMPKEEFESEFKVEGEVDDDALYQSFKWGWPCEEVVEELDAYSYYDEVFEYVLVTYSMADGHYAVTVDEISRPEYLTPDKMQWVFTSEDLDEILLMGAGSTTYCLDLNVSIAEQYKSQYGFTAGIAFALEPLYGEETAGMWMSPNGLFAPHTVTPTDAESGVITFNGAEIEYSNFDGESCTFDLTNIFGVVVEATLAEEELTIQAQG